MYCRAHKTATLTPIQHTVGGGELRKPKNSIKLTKNRLVDTLIVLLGDQQIPTAALLFWSNAHLKKATVKLLRHWINWALALVSKQATELSQPKTQSWIS